MRTSEGDSRRLAGVGKGGSAPPLLLTTQIGEMWRLNGHATAAFGKSHETPMWELSAHLQIPKSTRGFQINNDAIKNLARSSSEFHRSRSSLVLAVLDTWRRQRRCHHRRHGGSPRRHGVGCVMTELDRGVH